MIRLLKRFADWLDKRFPPKFHVTEEVFQSFLQRESEHLIKINTQAAVNDAQNSVIANLDIKIKMLEENLFRLQSKFDEYRITGGEWESLKNVQIESLQKQVEKLGSSIAAVKDSIVKGSSSSVQVESRRAEFIASGRIAE